MNREDQIIEYLEGNLSKEESIAFEAKIAADEDLKKDVELFKKVIQGIESEGANELKEYLQQRLNEPEIRSNSRAWMYAAASVSILLLGYVAIFKYTQTGSIQKTKDYITLKDKSMNRLKFWKKSKPSDVSESDQTSQTRSPYLDSIDMLDDEELVAINKDKDYIIHPEEEPVSESLNDGNNLAVENFTGNRLSNDEVENFEVTDTIVFHETVIASINVKPIDLKLIAPTTQLEIDRTVKEQSSSAPLAAKSKINSKELKVTSSSTEKTKSEESNLTKKTSQKSKKTIAKNIEVVNIELVNTDENKQKIIEKWGSNLQLKLINISGENPLVYHIGDYYYLQIQRDIYKLKGVSNTNENPQVIEDENIKGIILLDE